jgi:hypothetical protein
MGQGLESGFIGDFRHPQMRIEQEAFGPLDAESGQIIGEIDAGSLLK